MKELLMKNLRKIYLDEFARRFYKNLKTTRKLFLWNFRRKFGQVDKRIIESYLAEREIRKLQIGC